MIDLHMHSLYSDGTEDVETIIHKVARAGIKYFSITDHDIADSAREIFSSEKLQGLIKEYGLTYVTGIEFTCKFNDYKMHILGYDYDPNLSQIKVFEDEIMTSLKEKDFYRDTELEKKGYIFSQDSINFLKTKKNIRKLDVANCLVKDGYFNDNQEAIRVALDPIKYPRSYRLDGKQVVKTLSDAGVKMVWAHSLHGINEKPLSLEEVETQIVELKKIGLSGLECYYSLYNKEEIEGLKKIAEKHGLFITCGSDYHGTNKYVNLTELSCDGTTPKDDEIIVTKTFKHIIK